MTASEFDDHRAAAGLLEFGRPGFGMIEISGVPASYGDPHEGKSRGDRATDDAQ
jgi:hypothetical protein